MNLVGMIGTAVLSLTLVAAAPVFAQEQHDQQEEQRDKPEEKAQPEKSAKPAEKPAAQDEKSTKPEEKNAQAERQPAGNNGGGRIPAAKYQANFGRQHTFHVSQGDYSNRRFQYGGYTFGFAGAWPSNWLYTQDVYVVEINGVYYLCNPSYPGVNIELSFTL
jgi:hemolysin activation/secretion protein